MTVVHYVDHVFINRRFHYLDVRSQMVLYLFLLLLLLKMPQRLDEINLNAHTYKKLFVVCLLDAVVLTNRNLIFYSILNLNYQLNNQQNIFTHRLNTTMFNELSNEVLSIFKIMCRSIVGLRTQIRYLLLFRIERAHRYTHTEKVTWIIFSSGLVVRQGIRGVLNVQKGENRVK